MTNKTTAGKSRKITVCNKSVPYKGVYQQVPIISFRGHWLREAGFRAGHLLEIVCEEGRLVITIAREQRYSHVCAP